MKRCGNSDPWRGQDAVTAYVDVTVCEQRPNLELVHRAATPLAISCLEKKKRSRYANWSLTNRAIPQASAPCLGNQRIPKQARNRQSRLDSKGGSYEGKGREDRHVEGGEEAG